MKRTTALLMFASVILFTSCDKPTPEKAADYYDSIISKTNPLLTKYEGELISSFKNFVPKEMNEKLGAFKTYVTNLDNDLKEIDPFYEDKSIISSAKNLVSGYVKVVPLYEEKVEIESLPDSLYSTDKKNRSKDIMEEIDLVLNTLNEIYTKETNEFAKKYDFKIKKPKKNDEVKK